MLDLSLEREVRRLKETGTSNMKFPLFKGKPFDFQLVGAHMAYIVKHMLLMDPVGMGKTIQALLLATRIMEMQRNGYRKTARILVAVEAPTRFQWVEEIKRFTGVNAVTPAGTKKSRYNKYEALLSRDVSFLVVNHSKLFVDFDWLNMKYRPDLFILDEASIVSNVNKTHKFAKWMSAAPEWVLLMTAEPITRGDVLQIRNLYKVLGEEIMEEQHFIDQFVVTETKRVFIRGREGPFAKTITTPIGVKNVSKFKELIYGNTLRRPESVLGERRVLNRQLISVEMTDEQKRMYAELKKRILSTTGGLKEIEAISTAHYMSQMLASPWIINKNSPRESPKARALTALVKKLYPEKLVVFSRWKDMHKLIEADFKASGIEPLMYSGDLSPEERHELLTRFTRDDSCKVLVMTQAGQKGLNLQVSRNIAFTDLLYSPATMRQIVGRIDRIGQKHRILNMFFIVAEDSTEMGIMSVLKDRQTITDAVLGGDKADMFSEDFSTEKLMLDF